MSSKYPDDAILAPSRFEFPPDPMRIANLSATNFLKRVTMATTPGERGFFSTETPDLIALMVAAIDLETDIRLIADGREPHDQLPSVNPFDGLPLPNSDRNWVIPTVNAMIMRAQAIRAAAVEPSPPPTDQITELREYIMLRRQLRNFLDGI